MSKNIYAAFLAAQREFTPVKKSATNPHFRSRYATLDDILEMCVPVLNKHGLVLSQRVEGECLHTALYHESGEHLDLGAMHMLLDKQNMQGLGSATTYSRRYALGAALGIATEEDDDGNAASFDRSGAPVNAKPVRNAKPLVSPQEAVSRIEAATSLQQLKSAFEALPASVKAHPDVVAAKDAAKQSLSTKA